MRRRAAHPRSRGENTRADTRSPGAAGSSPLTRGKPKRFRALQHSRRLIPAHAGKTPPQSAARQRPWAHPRSRGENLRGVGEHSAHRGSSPLTRGKPSRRRRTQRAPRLIPAHAGKTAAQPPPIFTRTAHPRSRGENAPPALSKALDTGSSPLTRGKPVPVDGELLTEGLIPAHAGKTTRRHARAPHLRAHPRSRGENGYQLVSGDLQERLIPAHAGKTSSPP